MPWRGTFRDNLDNEKWELKSRLQQKNWKIKLRLSQKAESNDRDEYSEQRDKKLSLGSPTSKKKEL